MKVPLSFPFVFLPYVFTSHLLRIFFPFFSCHFLSSHLISFPFLFFLSGRNIPCYVIDDLELRDELRLRLSREVRARQTSLKHLIKTINSLTHTWEAIQVLSQ